MSGASNGQVSMYVGHRLTVSRTVSILSYSLVIYIPLITSLLCLVQLVTLLVLGLALGLGLAFGLASFSTVTRPFLNLFSLSLPLIFLQPLPLSQVPPPSAPSI